ncbi:hypothetical protein EUTSA_v10002823mg, partial [Eutrema salsugineum]
HLSSTCHSLKRRQLRNYHNKFSAASLYYRQSKALMFDEMRNRDASCYNAMIRGLTVHGFSQKAIKLYKSLISQGLIPDEATFVVTISACSHSGLVEDGLQIFHSMKAVYGIEPKVEHYGCLVDLLGRSGRLEEAEEKNASRRCHNDCGDRFLGQLKSTMIWRGKWKGVEITSFCFNIYAGVNRWGDVEKTLELMKDHRVSKSPGISTIS